MQKNKRIKAIFFLSLFSMLMMHQAFPHSHHQHEDTHSHSDLIHTGEHHHHHHDDNPQEREKSPYGILSFLMDMHVHSTVSSEMVVFKQNTIVQRTVTDDKVVNSPYDFKRFYGLDDWHNGKPPLYHLPNHHFNTYLSTLNLRGPPSLRFIG